jgi:hypothetical protein
MLLLPQAAAWVQNLGNLTAKTPIKTNKLCSHIINPIIHSPLTGSPTTKIVIKMLYLQ